MFILSRENAIRFMALAAHAVGNDKNPVPITKNVHISFTQNHVQVRAMNLITTVTMEGFAETGKSEPAQFLLPWKLFNDLLGKLKGEFLTLIPEYGKDGVIKNVNVVCGTYKGKLPAFDADDYPSFSTTYHSNPSTISSEWLATVYKRAAFASGDDSVAPVLRGVYLYTTDSAVIAAATDGYRMAETCRFLDHQVGSLEVLIPSASFKVLAEAVKLNWFTPIVDIGLTSDGNTVHFQSGDVVVSSRVINGKFPPYKRFFPDNEENNNDIEPWTFKIAVKEFANMVDIAAVTADTDGKIILTIEDNDQGGSQLLIQSGTSTESGASTYTIQLDGINPDEGVQVAVNGKFLIESINAAPAEHIIVQIFEETKGVVLGTQTWKSVVQPMPL